MSVALHAALALAAQPTVPVCSVQVLPCKLSDGLNRAQGLLPVSAPDSRRVVFKHDAPGVPSELYSVPAYGGERPTRITVEGESSDFAGISADSARVLYTHSEGAGRNRLFSVPISGPASARVRLADDVGVQPEIRLSPDARKVVFLLPGRDGVRVVPTEGPATAGRRLTAPFAAGAIAGSVRISDDSKSVVYRSDQATVGVTEVFRVPLTLAPDPVPPTTRINGPLVAGGDVSDFVLAPNAVVYLADQDTNDRRELYRAGLGGGARAKLSTPLEPGWQVSGPVEGDGPDSFIYDISRDSRRVAHVQGPDVFSTPIGGGALVKLDGSGELAGGFLRAGAGRFTYSASVGGRNALFSADGIGPRYELTAPLPGSSVGRDLTPDGTRLLFISQQIGGPVELFSSRLAPAVAPPA